MPEKKTAKSFRKIISFFIIIGLAISFLIGRAVYKDYQFKKYGGHGFEYMGGYSSTDFTGYHVYDGEKLVKLDHEASLQIENVEEMPVLDGAEACYPVYAAVAKAIYKDIDVIESEVQALDGREDLSEEEMEWVWRNGRVVTFTNTVVGYTRLINGEVDLIFGASPSVDQINEAAEMGETMVPIPIGKEAFVFFVEEDNPVDNISSEVLRKIYSGEITNWKELGGKNQEIVAFQRPRNSGSQAMMEYFMGETPLMEPDVMTRVSSMGGVIERVKEYHNERGAIGYTFQFFLRGLQQEKGVKMLSVDGVYPSVENIKNGTYPITIKLVCTKLESNHNPNVQKVIDFLLSPDGQEIIKKTGYGPL